MRPRLRAGWTAITLVIVLGLALAPATGTRRARALGDEPPGPDRAAGITVYYTAYEWLLISWAFNEVACHVVVDHEGLPTYGEVYYACGEDIYDRWVTTAACDDAESSNPQICRGYYLQLWDTFPAHREVAVALPPPVVWVTLDGCTSVDSTHLCGRNASLVLTAEEPLPNETIDRLEGTIDGEPFVCDPACLIDLFPTGAQGVPIEFWAYSSYGDSSLVYQAQVRMVEVVSEIPGEGLQWYVDVLSTQWRGTPLAGCSQVWEAFPPIGGPPGWLLTPETPAELATEIPYEYLASNLLLQGMADAGDCPNNGLLPGGQISPCGLEAALPAVTDWQNRFDELIFEVALDTGVPAQLLKNLFSRESQFWPGVFTGRPEVGLGQLTDNGADTTLLWNPSFYEQFCPLVLEAETCETGYPLLDEETQEMLRGALVRSVDAFCPDCPLSIDLQQADFSVAIFAETILANCEQTGMVLYNVYGLPPGEVASYEDLWRFTLVNYNAGPGCLGLAINETDRAGEPLDWEHVSAHLTPVCDGARDYVADITR
ncbi:MAG: hypothetical protein JXB85_02485 [Anaerolineales bacterium]|nr:hypothetical protein [Anaerolineales bacterium]